MLSLYLSLLETEAEQCKFQRIYEEYRSVMFQFAIRILKDKTLAEDVVHDSFLSLIKNLHKVPDECCNKTRNYLIVIVMNASRQLYNEKKKHMEVALPEETLMDKQDIVFESEEKDIQERIGKMIKTMNPIYADVLLLKLFYEFSDREIATALNITSENVRVRFHRGRNQLKKMVKEMLDDDGR